MTMTPEQYNEQIQEKINEHMQKINHTRIWIHRSIAMMAILWSLAILLGIIRNNLDDLTWLILPLSVMFAVTMYADAFSIYNHVLTKEEQDVVRFPMYLDQYKHVKYKNYWIFFKPSIRSSYTFFDEEFNIVIRDLHLKRTYQKSLNNELYNLDNDNFDKSDLVIDKLLTEIDML